jgi:hypothetical protein
LLAHLPLSLTLILFPLLPCTHTHTHTHNSRAHTQAQIIESAKAKVAAVNQHFDEIAHKEAKEALQ